MAHAILHYELNTKQMYFNVLNLTDFSP